MFAKRPQIACDLLTDSCCNLLHPFFNTSDWNISVVLQIVLTYFKKHGNVKKKKKKGNSKRQIELACLQSLCVSTQSIYADSKRVMEINWWKCMPRVTTCQFCKLFSQVVISSAFSFFFWNKLKRCKVPEGTRFSFGH